MFLILNVILFVRPAELIESLQPFRLYQLAILGCLATTYPSVLSQLSTEALFRRPVTMCVFGILAAVVFSNLQFGLTYEARTYGYDFAKIVLYYLLLLCNLDTPKKFQQFLTSLVIVTAIAASLALLQFHHVVEIPALAAYEQREMDEETGEMIVFPRLCGAGIFNDPNDICLLLVLVMMICLYRFTTPGAGPKRFIWVAPMLLFLLAFVETKSRGGFISLMIGLNVLIVERVGFRKAIPIWLAGAPIVLVLFGGRMTRVEVDGGTGQHRIQLWREALALVRVYPLLGVGRGMLPEYTRLVAHNSYIHAFAELGLVGGSCFISGVYMIVSQLRRLKRFDRAIVDPEMRRLRPYLLGMVAGFFSGVMFLSRVYIVPTYMIVGMAAAFLYHTRLKDETESPIPTFNASLFLRLSAISMSALVALELGSRLMVR